MRWLPALIVSLSLIAESSPAQTPDEVREAQSLLIRVDRNPGPVDGVWGRRTEAALVDFLAERGLDFDGELTGMHLALLRDAPEGPSFVRQELGLPYTLTPLLRGNRDQPEAEPATRYDSWELPEFVDPNPNLATLRSTFSSIL
jgi:peptidoglycan hydrolase-like protein with peptidoglycan-binding domain